MRAWRNCCGDSKGGWGSRFGLERLGAKQYCFPTRGEEAWGEWEASVSTREESVVEM
jgi:hypothetical protein